MHSEVHKFNVQLVAQIRHSLIPLDVNASPYEKRKRKRGGGGGAGKSSSVGTSHHKYWFVFLHPVIVLTLLNRIARYVCTYNPCVQQQQIKIKTAKKREGGLLLEENQSSSLRNRLSSEGNREYNKQEEFKRAERREAIASKSTAAPPHPRSCNPPSKSLHRFTISKIYPLEGGWFCRESSKRKNATWIHTCLW